MVKVRHLYRRLTDLPAWGLYVDDKLVATIRAETAFVARDLFRAFGYDGGGRVRKIKEAGKR